MLDLTREEDQLDLALAAELQAGLLPSECPTDCPHQVAAARNRMSGGVGGDFYDFIRLNTDQLALVIGDVVGHGIRAALIMAQIMGYLRSRPPDIARPAAAISSLNGMLIDLGRRTNLILPCSLLYGVIDSPSGIGFFVNAGHHAPILCEDGACRTLGLDARNILLGIEDFAAEESCITFTPGQRLVLHTDGLVDASNGAGERFGEGRLRRVIAGQANSTPDACADAVFAAVDQFRGDEAQEDDETIVVIDRI